MTDLTLETLRAELTTLVRAAVASAIGELLNGKGRVK